MASWFVGIRLQWRGCERSTSKHRSWRSPHVITQIQLCRPAMSTRRWWPASDRFPIENLDLVIPNVCGDSTAACGTIGGYSNGIGTFLRPTDEAESLGRKLCWRASRSETEPRGCCPYRLSAVQGMAYLVTWNFKHILTTLSTPDRTQFAVTAGYIPCLRFCFTPNNCWTFDDF